MADRPAPGASADAVSADLIAHRSFTVSRKGFDTDEVKEFLQLAAGAVRGLHQRVEALEASLVDAEHRIANPRLDEDTLLRMVGEETGSILRSARAAAKEMSATAERESRELRESAERESAELLERSISDVAHVRATADAEAAALRESAERDTAEQRALAAQETTELRETTARELAELRESIETHTTALRTSAERESTEMRARAEAEAARVVDEARQQAGDLRGEAETVLARHTEEADQVAARIQATAQETANQLLERARREADSVRQQAEADRKLTVEGAQAVREKILEDLARRRRVASTQIEQLRAGRERLLESYGVVRRTLEEVNDELHRADTEAREAAAAAGRAYEQATDQDIVTPDLLTMPLPVVEAKPSTQMPGPAEAEHEEDRPLTAEDPADADSDSDSDTDVVGAAATDTDTDTDADADAGEAGAAATEAGAIDASDAVATPVTGTPDADEVAEVVEATPRPPAGGIPALGAAADGPAPAAALPSGSVGSESVGSESVGSESVGSESAGIEEVAAPATSPVPPATAAGATKPKRARRGTARPPAAVDDLFARIKAGRQDAVAHAKEVLHEPDAAVVTDTATPAAVPPPTSARTRPSAAAPNETPETVAGAEAEAVDATHPAVAPSDDLEPRRSDEEEGWLQRRDEALGQTETSLTRKLKRALQDEQNDLLDRLRSLRGRPTADSLLPRPEDQQGRFVLAGSVLVEEGADRGTRFAMGVLGDAGRRPSRPSTSVADLVDGLAAEIVVPLRRRLEQTIAESGDDDQTVLVEALGGAYREWKTQRIERIAGDALAAAFARGALNATPEGGTLRWVVDDLDGPCSDCDDNVLAGALPRHEAWPTGQQHPPAHTGCRCILVPVLVPAGAGAPLA